MINNEISPLLKGKDVLALKKVDDILANFQKKKSEADIQVNDNVLRACSEAILYSYAQTVCPSAPYSALYRYLKNRDLQPGQQLPKLMFNVLNGGKALGSKVKFSRFYLILDISSEDEAVDATEVFLKI
jgi:enolase